MEGPNQFGFVLFKVGEEHPKVAVVAVQIVQMHNVGPDTADVPYHFPRGKAGIKPIVAKQSGCKRLKFGVYGIGAGNTQRIAACFTAVKNIIFHSVFRQQLTDTCTDFTRTAHTAGGIDLENFHVTYSQKK